MAAVGPVLVLCLCIVVSGCVKTQSIAAQKPVSNPSQATEKAKTPLSQIDLSKIEHIAPKGRVQDKAYNDLEVVDQLIANGKDSIPFLISKLDNKNIVHKPLMDFWPELAVGDVAFLILCDFSLDSTWTKETIPGAGFGEFFETKTNPDQPACEYYYDQLKKHGRRWVKAKWQKIWTSYKDRIVWDDKERCFKVV